LPASLGSLASAAAKAGEKYSWVAVPVKTNPLFGERNESISHQQAVRRSERMRQRVF